MSVAKKVKLDHVNENSSQIQNGDEQIVENGNSLSVNCEAKGTKPLTVAENMKLRKTHIG